MSRVKRNLEGRGTDSDADICSDKTGTITVGRMVVKKAWSPADANGGGGRTFEVESGQE